MLPEDLDPPDRRVRILGWVIALMLVLGFGACLSEGAGVPDDPRLSQARLDGFGEIAIRIEPAPNQLRCALLASNEQQRARGLMEVGPADIKGYVGMVFRYATDSQAAFHMRNTRMPLSIAWFDATGSFVSSTDMAPCPDAEPNCPVYGAAGPYRYALEVPQGQLPALGIGPGSKLVIAGGLCPDGAN